VSQTSQPARPARTPEEIETDLARTRAALADSIDEIGATLAPANLARRAQRSAVAALQTPDGAWDPKKLAVVAGVGLVLVVYLVRRRGA
jgi:hypothetical protein